MNEDYMQVKPPRDWTEYAKPWLEAANVAGIPVRQEVKLSRAMANRWTHIEWPPDLFARVTADHSSRFRLMFNRWTIRMAKACWRLGDWFEERGWK